MTTVQQNDPPRSSQDQPGSGSLFTIQRFHSLWRRLTNIPEKVPGIKPLALTVAVFAVFKNTYNALFDSYPGGLPFIFVAFACLAIAYRRLNYQNTSASYRILLRGISIILGFYSAVAYISASPDPGTVAGKYLVILEIMRAVAVACAVAAWFRPSFATLPAIYVLLVKDVGGAELGLLQLSHTDYQPVVELGIYLSLGTMCYSVHSKYRHGKLPGHSDTEDEFSFLLFMTAVAAHFGNYLWSALTKIQLDGGPLSWVFENRTSQLMANSNVTGHLPIAQWPVLSHWVFSTLDSSFVLFNAVTLATQLLCVVAITRIRLAILITLFYDISHIAIYITTGIFFWKWILLNFIIVIALAAARDRELAASTRLLAAFFTVAGALVFFAARLGWYDTRAVNNIHISAITEDGSTHMVPSNYFLTSSIAFAQQRVGDPGRQAFPTGTWGSTNAYAVMQGGLDGCQFKEGMARKDNFGREDIEDFIRRYHAYALTRLDKNGRFNYELYPHHIFSNFWQHQDFFQLDKRKIVKYIYMVDLVCVAQNIDPSASRLVAHYEHDISVR